MQQSTRDSYQRSELAYKDPDVLHELYHEQWLSMPEMADELNVKRSTIRYWMDKHEIVRYPGGSGKPPHVDVRTNLKGYEMASDANLGDRKGAYIHQLLAIANGADPYKVFSNGDYQVHHCNSIEWDNRPSNLRFLSATEHNQLEARRQKDAKRSRSIRGEFLK